MKITGTVKLKLNGDEVNQLIEVLLFALNATDEISDDSKYLVVSMLQEFGVAEELEEDPDQEVFH